MTDSNVKDYDQLVYDRIVVYTRIDGKYAWQYVSAGNSEIMGTDGSQGYEGRQDCLRGAFRVCGVTKGNPPHDGSYDVGGVVYDLAAQPQRVGTHDGGAVWTFPIRIPE